METLSAWFKRFCALRNTKVITVIGSGGKTSLIWHLAASFAPSRKILVTPTAKMLAPPPGAKLYDRYYDRLNYDGPDNEHGGVLSEPLPGITLAGLFNRASGKLESLPPPLLEKVCPGYDLVLIEGDGSRGLPLKAWTEDEPVVPPFTGLTAGVLPLWPLGKPVSEEIIHRLPLFLVLTGTARGETVRPEHLVRIITGRRAGAGGPAVPGLFAKAQRGKLLFFNQVEDEAGFGRARELAGLLPSRFRRKLCGIIAGSVREDRVTEL